jgi:hypothetical protein
MSGIQTYSGLTYDFEAENDGAVTVHDIASSLSKLCRFNGHCLKFYSVAEHSVWVSRVLPQELAYVGLMHDAHEAFFGDISRPLKKAIGHRDGGALHELEGVVQDEVCRALGVNVELLALVKEADTRMGATEVAQIMAKGRHKWTFKAEPYQEISLACWSPEEARTQFLSRYVELTLGKAGVLA